MRKYDESYLLSLYSLTIIIIFVMMIVLFLLLYNSKNARDVSIHRLGSATIGKKIQGGG